MNAGSAVASVIGPTSAPAEVVTAETEEEMVEEEEILTEEEMTQENVADHPQDTDVVAAEATRERLRDVKDAALDASNVDTLRPTALREVAAVASETQEETIVATEVTDVEMTEVAMAEKNPAAATQEVALHLVEAIGITIAHPQGTEAHLTTVVMIATTVEAPHATTSERPGGFK